MITITLRKRNQSRIDVPIAKSALRQFRKAWQLAHAGVGDVLVVYNEDDSELLKISVPDIQKNYHEMIQVRE